MKAVVYMYFRSDDDTYNVQRMFLKIGKVRIDGRARILPGSSHFVFYDKPSPERYREIPIAFKETANFWPILENQETKLQTN